MPRFEGVLCPTVTFFDARGEVDLEAFKRHVANLVDRGLHGVAPIGTMGEFTLLDEDERKWLAEAAVEAVGDRGIVLIGAGSPRTDRAVDFSRHAEDIGAHGVYAITPFYLKPNRDGLRRHYEAIHRAVGIPVFGYNLPSFTGYSLDNGLIVELAEEGILQGLKDSEGDLAKDIQLLTELPRDFALFTGADPLCLAVLAQGAAGAILGTSNLFPATLAELYKIARAGDMSRAAEIQAGVSRLSQAIQTGPFPAAIKYMVERVWGLRSSLRMPVTELSPDERKQVDTLLEPLLAQWR